MCAEVNNTITDEKIDRYLSITKRALNKLRPVAPERTIGKSITDNFLTMANSYYSDAEHFREIGDVVTAFAAVNYAHGWLDCGARLGLWDVEGDD